MGDGPKRMVSNHSRSGSTGSAVVRGWVYILRIWGEDPRPSLSQKPMTVPLLRSLIHLTRQCSPMLMLILSPGYHMFALYPSGHRWKVSLWSWRCSSRRLMCSWNAAFSLLWSSSQVRIIMHNDLQIPWRVSESMSSPCALMRLMADLGEIG